jgi:predicted O-methyltransferase YrrM
VDRPGPDWFSQARPYFERHLLPLADRDLHCLQLGVYLGDASLWLMEHLPKAQLTDVDTWEGSDETEHDELDWAGVETYYDQVTWDYARRIRKFVGTTETFFDYLEFGLFDFIYVDADHRAPEVLTDAVRSWRHLKVGGILAFDDYTWQAHSGILLDAPKVGIDAFCATFLDRLEVMETGAQVWVRKTR